MADWSERAFDLVTEITKQVLTLATGIIALTITFAKDFATHDSAASRDLLAWSWAVYVLSILFGFLTLMASAGVQQAAGDAAATAAADTGEQQQSGSSPSINASNIRVLGSAQLLAFLVAIVLTVIAGAIAV